MKKKIKIIDLLCLISNYEEVPSKIKYEDYILEFDGYNYIDNEGDCLNEHLLADLSNINDEVEILDDEEEKDIPLIPEDELYKLYNMPKLNYNFKVLQEKINQVVEEFNEYRRDNEIE